MADALTTFLIAAGSSLLTILVTQRLQRLHWQYQRRDELRLEAINEVRGLSAEFITEYIESPGSYRPSKEFLKKWSAMDAQVKALFPEKTFQVYKKMEVMIGPNLGPTGKGSVDSFIQARDEAMHALYSEVVPLSPRT